MRMIQLYLWLMTIIEACLLLQESISYIQRKLKKWRIRANETKQVYMIFTIRKETCSLITLNDLRISQAEDAEYIGLHFDRRLNWKIIYSTSENNLDFNWKKCSTSYSAINRNCCYENKLLLEQEILKPIWTYGFQLWGTVSNTNIEILQRFKYFKIIINALWYIIWYSILHFDVSSVRNEIKRLKQRYGG